MCPSFIRDYFLFRRILRLFGENKGISCERDQQKSVNTADVAKDFIGDDTMDAIEKVEFSEDDIDIFPNSSEAKESAVNDPVKEKQISK